MRFFCAILQKTQKKFGSLEKKLYLCTRISRFCAMLTHKTYTEDIELVAAILKRDEDVTRSFFFDKCRGMLTCVMQKVFAYPVEYDELVNALYLYLMEKDAYRLRQYKGRSTIYLWLQTIATRFFIQYRDQVIDNTTDSPLLEDISNEPIDDIDDEMEMCTIRSAFEQMPNRRYAFVLQRLVIDEANPKTVAEEMGITIDNLYNIKKRALTQLTQQLTQLKKQ